MQSALESAEEFGSVMFRACSLGSMLCAYTVQGEGDGENCEVSVKVCLFPLVFVSLA